MVSTIQSTRECRDRRAVISQALSWQQSLIGSSSVARAHHSPPDEVQRATRMRRGGNGSCNRPRTACQAPRLECLGEFVRPENLVGLACALFAAEVLETLAVKDDLLFRAVFGVITYWITKLSTCWYIYQCQGCGSSCDLRQETVACSAHPVRGQVLRSKWNTTTALKGQGRRVGAWLRSLCYQCSVVYRLLRERDLTREPARLPRQRPSSAPCAAAQ